MRRFGLPQDDRIMPAESYAFDVLHFVFAHSRLL